MSWIAKLLGEPEPRIRVLGILPGAADRVALTAIAERAGWDLKLATDTAGALRTLKHYSPRVIICDREQPDCDWRETLSLLSAKAPASSSDDAAATNFGSAAAICPSASYTISNSRSNRSSNFDSLFI